MNNDTYSVKTFYLFFSDAESVLGSCTFIAYISDNFILN